MTLSIIVTHWAQDMERTTLMTESIFSLIKTTEHLNPEIIVVDNGPAIGDSEWLLNLTNEEKIACYIRNRKNMGFGYARNQALALATGDYIVIADNDIVYEDGWLDDCLAFLTSHEGMYLATPLAADPMNRRDVRWVGELDGWFLNTRAGSNCFVGSREAFNTIGKFGVDSKAGSKWTDASVRKGYVMAVPQVPKATDKGFRKGFNFRTARFDTTHL